MAFSATPFRPGSIFFADLHSPADSNTNKIPASTSLASPPPSPSRNSIFDQSPAASPLAPRSLTPALRSHLPHKNSNNNNNPSAASYSTKIHLHNALPSSTTRPIPRAVSPPTSTVAASPATTDPATRSLQEQFDRKPTGQPTLHHAASSPGSRPRSPLSPSTPTHSIFGPPSLSTSDDESGSQPHHALEELAPFSLTLDCCKTNLLGHGRHAEVYKAIIHPSSTPMRQYLLSRKGKHAMSCKDLLQTNTPTSSNHASFPCAAKCLYADTDSQALGLAEANILRRLHTHKALHPGRQHLVDYFGLYERSAKRGISPFDNTQQLLAPQNDQDESWVLLLEYCHNGTIWDWIRQYPDRVGHRQWLAWAIQLLQATTCIHEAGLIHHDIKPHNILLDSALDAKLSDFGAGIFLNPESAPEDARSQLSLEEGRGRGTLPYAAPEMFASSSGNASYNQAIDIYSLGVSLYVIGLTAQEPFHKLKSVMEMIVWIKKGGFWLWEDQSWVHDRGPVPKTTPTSRQQNPSSSSSSSSSSSLTQEHLVRKHMVPRASTYSAPNLPPINTQLPFDRGLLSPSSACSTNSPMALAPGANANANHSVPPGYSPEKPTRLSQPATPVSPLPLPSPILRSQTPRSAARKEEQQQRKSGEIVMRFLNGEVVPSEIVLLLKEMCHPVPEQRPLASTVLQRLLAMQDQLDSDMDKDMDIDDVDISMV